jgi:hypothetical protein
MMSEAEIVAWIRADHRIKEAFSLILSAIVIADQAALDKLLASLTEQPAPDAPAERFDDGTKET